MEDILLSLEVTGNRPQGTQVRDAKGGAVSKAGQVISACDHGQLVNWGRVRWEGLNEAGLKKPHVASLPSTLGLIHTHCLAIH